jgi:carboxylesterase type B
LDENFFTVIDGHVLPTAPVNIYASAAQSHVELLTGVNSDDGYMVFIGISRKFGLEPAQLNVAFARAFMTGFVTNFFSFPSTEAVVEAIHSQYLNEVSATASPEELQKILVEFISDTMFVIPAIQTANFHSRSYNFFSRLSLSGVLGSLQSQAGRYHISHDFSSKHWLQ